MNTKTLSLIAKNALVMLAGLLGILVGVRLFYGFRIIMDGAMGLVALYLVYRLVVPRRVLYPDVFSLEALQTFPTSFKLASIMFFSAIVFCWIFGKIVVAIRYLLYP